MPQPKDFPVISHPFQGGIQSNVDDKALTAPKLSFLENCWFQKRGVISKRPGSTLVSTNFSGQDASNVWQTLALDSIRAMFESRDELVAVDADGVPFSWSPSTGRWWSQPSQGNLLAPRITIDPAIKDATVHTSYDVAQTNGWRLTVYSTGPTGFPLKFQVQDAVTDTVVIPPTVFGNANSRTPAAIAVGNTLFALYVDTTANQLRALRITVTVTPATAGGTDQLVAANIRTPYIYDSDTDANLSTGVSTLAAIAYSASTTIETLTLNSAGTVVSGPTAESGTGGTIETIGVAFDPIASNIGVAWVRNNAGSRSLRAVIRTSVLGAVAAETTVHSGYSTMAPLTQTACVFQAATTGGVRVMHILYADGLTGTPITTPPFVRHATFASSAAVGGPNIYAQNAILCSRAFRDVGASSMGTMMVNLIPPNSLVQNKVILCTLGGTTTPATPIAYYKGKYVSPASGCHLSPIAVYNEGGYGGRSGITQTHVQPLGNRLYLTAVGFPLQHLLDAVSFGGGDSFDVVAGQALLDFSASNAQAVAVNGVTYLSGGLLQQHDGGIAEAGFITYLDASVATFTSSSGGSMTPSASYSYIIRKERMNARGIVERSTFIARTVTTGTTHTRMTITIPTDSFTAWHLQRPFSYQVYRTAANPPANPTYYLVSNLDPADTSGSNRYVANDPSVGTVTFVDDRADSSMAQFGILDVGLTDLDPINVPHCTCMATDGSRLWVGGLDDPNMVWPSLLVSGSNTGVEFNEALQIRCDDFGGAVTGLAVLNERVIVFKERALYAILGDGPDNTGANGAFSSPQLLHSDVGLAVQATGGGGGPATICQVDDGILFFSTKGWCIIGQDLKVKYVGAPVESYNTQQFTAVVQVPGKRQIRCLARQQPSLLYDYEIDQWSTLTGTFSGMCAATYLHGQLVYGKSTGASYWEDTTGLIWTDGGAEYSMIIRTGWLHGPSLQEYLTGGRIAVLGTYFDFHKLRVTIWFNYSAIAENPVDYVPGNAQPYQFRMDLPARHEFQSVQIQLSDLSDGAHALGQSLDIVELAAELTQAGGIMRLSAARSI